jgi:hypothetical protein
MVRFWTITLILFGIAGLSWTATADAASRKKVLPKLNRKVIEYAQARMGKQVGNGECWTLADLALSFAGARRPGRDGLALYAFGRKLSSKTKLLPGDVLQFEKAEFYHQDKSGWSSQSMPHHTAIVYKVSGTKVTLLNQNVGGDKTVKTTIINLAERTKGTITRFRPQAREN